MQLLVVLAYTLLNLFVPAEKATIVFAGDAMQHQSQLDNARRGNSYDYSGTFDAIKPWVSAADYAVVNFETTIAERGFTGYPCFASPLSYAKALKDTGFDLFLNANNHTLDRRDAGLKRTIAFLDSLRVDHIGTYPNPDVRTHRLPLIKDIKGFKVAFLNYTYGTNGINVQGDAVVDYIDFKRAESDIANARAAGAELVIVMPHWGDEYHLVNNKLQEAQANKFLNAGADAVVGGHPHVIQPMKVVTHNGTPKPVIYSMGNLISGMRTTDTRGGAMVHMTLVRDADGHPQIADTQYRLVYVVPGVAGKKADRLVLLDADTNVDSLLGQRALQAKAFLRNALSTFDKHNVNVTRYKP